MDKTTPGEWWADGLEIGTAPLMETKIAKVSGNSYEEAKANAKLMAQSKDLLEALHWALPMAIKAMEDHRILRIQCGHTDITGTYRDGKTWVGIYQQEVDKIEKAQDTLRRAGGY